MEKDNKSTIDEASKKGKKLAPYEIKETFCGQTDVRTYIVELHMHA